MGSIPPGGSATTNGPAPQGSGRSLYSGTLSTVTVPVLPSTLTVIPVTSFCMQ